MMDRIPRIEAQIEALIDGQRRIEVIVEKEIYKLKAEQITDLRHQMNNSALVADRQHEETQAAIRDIQTFNNQWRGRLSVIHWIILLLGSALGSAGTYVVNHWGYATR